VELTAEMTPALPRCITPVLSNYAHAVRNGDVTAKGQKKFCKIFNVVPGEGGTFRIADHEVFKKQALWGGRLEKGIVGCSNHDEGSNRQRKRQTRDTRDSLVNFVKIADASERKVEDFNQFAFRSARAELKKMEKTAKEYHFTDRECTHPTCDKGVVMGKRFGIADWPCPHVVLAKPPTIPDVIPLPAGSSSPPAMDIHTID
jgi:hypothetical protein